MDNNPNRIEERKQPTDIVTDTESWTLKRRKRMLASNSSSSVGLQKLLQEPQKLSDEVEKINQELESLIIENYKVFVENLTCNLQLQSEAGFLIYLCFLS
jgi:hypothetical protein